MEKSVCSSGMVDQANLVTNIKSASLVLLRRISTQRILAYLAQYPGMIWLTLSSPAMPPTNG
jgi:hypothetical protein